MHRNRRRASVRILIVAASTVGITACTSDARSEAGSVELSSEASTYFDSIESTLTLLRGPSIEAADGYEKRLQAEQDFYASCMSDEGFVYEVPPASVAPSAVKYVASWWSLPDVELAIGASFGYVQPIEELVSFASKSYASLSADAKVAYNRTLDKCIAAGAASGAYDGPLDPISFELEADLLGALTKETGEPSFAAIRDSYATCIRGFGYRFTSPFDAGDAVESALSELGFYALDPRSQESKSLFPRALEVERQIALADATCRQQSASDVAAILAPIAERWLDRNAEAVQAAVG